MEWVTANTFCVSHPGSCFRPCHSFSFLHTYLFHSFFLILFFPSSGCFFIIHFPPFFSLSFPFIPLLSFPPFFYFSSFPSSLFFFSSSLACFVFTLLISLRLDRFFFCWGNANSTHTVPNNHHHNANYFFCL